MLNYVRCCYTFYSANYMFSSRLIVYRRSVISYKTKGRQLLIFMSMLQISPLQASRLFWVLKSNIFFHNFAILSMARKSPTLTMSLLPHLIYSYIIRLWQCGQWFIYMRWDSTYQCTIKFWILSTFSKKTAIHRNRNSNIYIHWWC